MGFNLVWSTTTIKTRILMRDDIRHPLGSLFRLGHVRNIGCKKWYAEDYLTVESSIFDTLNEAKTWLENKQKVE